MVDQEARRVLHLHAGVAGGIHQRLELLQDLRRGTRAADDLNDAHQRHRVEEVQPGDPLRMLACGGDGGDRQRGRVGGENGVGADHALEFDEQRLLGVEPFDDRLDHHVASDHVGKGTDRDQSRQVRGHVGCIEAAFLRHAVPRLLDRLDGAARRLGRRVVEQHGAAGLRHDLGDAPSHHAGADDADPEVAHRRGNRSGDAAGGAVLVHRGIICDFAAGRVRRRSGPGRLQVQPGSARSIDSRSACSCSHSSSRRRMSLPSRARSRPRSVAASRSAYASGAARLRSISAARA